MYIHFLRNHKKKIFWTYFRYNYYFYNLNMFISSKLSLRARDACVSASKEPFVLALRRSRACRCKTQNVIHNRRAQSRWLLVSMYQEARKCSQVDLRVSRSLNASCFRIIAKTTVRMRESCRVKRRLTDPFMINQ